MPNWPRPDEQLAALIGRPGDLPRPGNDRWGNSKGLKPGENYTFVSVGMQPMIGAMALQLTFSLDNIHFSPEVPPLGSNTVMVTMIRAIDTKSGAFTEVQGLSPGETMPFCTFIAKGVVVSVQSPPALGQTLFVHCAVCPVQTMDCESLIAPASTTWADVESLSVPANTGGSFLALAANPDAKQIFIQNNSAVDLLLGFGSFVPALGPPPLSNMILPGGIHAIWESQLGAFVGAIHAIFAGGGVGTEFATFTRGV